MPRSLYFLLILCVNNIVISNTIELPYLAKVKYYGKPFYKQFEQEVTEFGRFLVLSDALNEVQEKISLSEGQQLILELEQFIINCQTIDSSGRNSLLQRIRKIKSDK